MELVTMKKMTHCILAVFAILIVSLDTVYTFEISPLPTSCLWIGTQMIHLEGKQEIL
jgi:hypothetical protein